MLLLVSPVALFSPNGWYRIQLEKNHCRHSWACLYQRKAVWPLLWIRYLCCNDQVFRLELNIFTESWGLITPGAAWGPLLKTTDMSIHFFRSKCPSSFFFMQVGASGLCSAVLPLWLHCDLQTVREQDWLVPVPTGCGSAPISYPPPQYAAEAACWWGCGETFLLDAIFPLSVWCTAGDSTKEAKASCSVR